RIRREPRFGGGDDALPLPRQDGLRGVVQGRPRLHFDEHQQPAPPCHDVELADRALPSPRQNAVALGDEIGSGATFRRETQPERSDTFGTRGVLWADRLSATAHYRSLS